MGVFESVKQRLRKVSEFMGLNDKEIELLLTHKSIQSSILEVNEKEYPAFRIIHNNALGPGKGGIRFHENVSEDETKALSFWMSLKNSLAGLPLGGAKGGVEVNSKELDKKEIEEISRSYIRAFHEFLGQDKDIPAPDAYTNPEVMGWMLDEYEKIKKKHEPGMITGKPIELGGIELRKDSTSQGGLIVLKEFLERVDKSKELKIAIQGLGNVGGNIAGMLHKEGFHIVAVSDSKEGIFSENYLDVQNVRRLKEEKKNISEYPDARRITNQELLESDVDILILAALENQITEENADKIKAKYILELANGPINASADEILLKKGIVVIPDILANSGGVVVSYFEWAQNKIGNILEEEFLNKKLVEMMSNAFHKVYELYRENKDKIDMRTAAYIIAIKRILAAEKARGNILS